MPPGDLVERSGALKRQLLAYANRVYEREVDGAIREHFGSVPRATEGEAGNFLDHFVLQHRLPDGRTVVDHFVAAHPSLPEAERAMMLGWQDVVEGIFEVQGREGEALFVANLVDELTYRVRSNVGPTAFTPMTPGSFLIARIVPVGDEWLFSGFPSLLPASARDDALLMAGKIALTHPKLVFRNPEKLEQAWKMQHDERENFVDFFGSDLLILAPREAQERLAEFQRFRMHEIRNAEGQSLAERAQSKYGRVSEPEFTLPEDLLQRDTVGVIFDEVEGLNYFPDFGLVDETFASPELLADPDHREAVLGYLESSGIIPLPLVRVAERHLEHVNQVYRELLDDPDFDWERDGEDLLREYKGDYMDRPPLPGVSPVSDAIARAQLASKRTRPKPQGRSRKRKKSRR